MKKPNGRGEWLLWASTIAAPLLISAPAWLGALGHETQLLYLIENPRRASCQSNLKQLGLAMLQYANDSDGLYPPATIGGARASTPPQWSPGPPALAAGWADAMIPYLESPGVLLCPSLPQPSSSAAYDAWRVRPMSAGFSHYWFNARLSESRQRTSRLPSQTFLLGEGSDDHDVNNATYSKTALPAQWLADAQSPLFRHLNGANFLFTDGHVKWLRPVEAAHFNGRADPFAP